MGSDQGAIMFALSSALHSGSLPQLGLPASVGAFHHGALYLDTMLPAAWLGGGSPALVLIETAIGGLLVVPMLWWVARSIGGPVAGMSAALLAATSGGLVLFSTFIWNPTLVEPGAALTLLGLWQAWSGATPAGCLPPRLGRPSLCRRNSRAACSCCPLEWCSPRSCCVAHPIGGAASPCGGYARQRWWSPPTSR